MSPLSILPATGLNLRSPFSHSPSSQPSGQAFPEDMTESQENVPPEDTSEEMETQAMGTMKSTSPTKTTNTTSTLPQLSARSLATLSPQRSPLKAAHNPPDIDVEEVNDVSTTDSHGFDPDNTCFSTFSAVPNVDMTNFTRQAQNLGGTPTPSRGLAAPLHSSRPTTPATAMPNRIGTSPTRSNRSPTRNHDSTTQLLEFTEQMDYTTQTTSRQSSPARTQNLMAGAGHRMRSPEGRTLNLLDFDLPPAPTPRSMPSITARELESLKAGFLSEISSLKAKLSGAQAEITSLKEAKDDAESRVGTLSEDLRNANGAKTALQQEKEDWQKHDAERRQALAKLKEEYVVHEEEISRLREEAEEQSKRYQDLENRAKDVEGRLQESEAKLAGYREEATNGDSTNPSTPGSNKAVEVAVEKVAKELHVLYKSKHEQKVAALKQSYEKRWKKKVDELAFKVEELEKENANIRDGGDSIQAREATPNGRQNKPIDDDAAARIQTLVEEGDSLRHEIGELNKRMETMSRGVTMLERDNVSLRAELQDSRKENSELVAVVDEMLAIDLAAPSTSSSSRPNSQDMAVTASDAGNTATRTAPSSSKISGLRGPGFGGYGESRIGGGGMALKRSTSGSGTRSGIMSNIERMGRGIGNRGQD